MKRHVQSVLLLGILLLSSVLPAFASDPVSVAVIKNIEQSVVITRDGIPLKQIHTGTELLKSDTIQTDSNGSVGIAFQDGTRISLGPKSQCTVKDYLFIPEGKQYSFKMYMQKGSMVYSSGKLGKLAPQTVQIATPQGTIGIRGTKLLIKVD